MQLKNLHICNYSEPIGIDAPPQFLWEYDHSGNGEKQTAYRLSVAKNPSFSDDSTVLSGEYTQTSEQTAAADFKLESHTKYFYRVEILDDTHELHSAASSFVTGIIGDWQGKWVTANTAKPFCTMHSFNVSREIREAYCSVCGLGQFILYLNGKRVGDHILDPGWTDYNKQVQYVTFDVTEYIKSGENCILSEIGAGWYLADTGDRHHYTKGFHGYRSFGEVLPFIFEMTVRYSDGTEEKIVSDDSWRTCPSPTVLANIYGSEDYDARLEPAINCNHAHASPLTADNAPTGILTAQKHPPVKIIGTYDIQKIDKRSDAVIYDFGQNMSGLFEIFVKGESGQRIKITPAEKLTPDGDICPSCNTFSVYTLKGDGIESWMPHFTYSAGRWVKIELFPSDENSSLPQIIDIKAHFVSSSAAVVGHFSCSDERCDKLMNIIEKAIESNLNHVHTDCPTVERLGWLEISHLMAPSIMYFKNVDTLWSKILRDICEAQYVDGERESDLFYPHYIYSDGMIPSIAPRYSHFVHAGTMGSFWDIVPWGNTLILGPLQQLRFYGNKAAIETCYESAKKYLSFLTSQYDDYNNIYGKRGDRKFLCHGLGDWGVLQQGTESRENVETAFFYEDLSVMADFADMLGRPEDKAELLKLAARVRDDYNAALLRQDPDTGDYFYNMYSENDTFSLTQTNQALPLFFGMVPEEKAESVRRSFLRSVEGHQINTGEIGLRYVLQLLNDMDRNDIVYDMIMQPEHPSYIRFVEKGETTLPEYWEDDARSHNHTMMGHIYEWFYSGVAGITSEDGFRHIRIAPRPPRQLSTVHCSYQAATGLIEESLHMTDTSFEMQLTIPGNTTTLVEIPAAYSSLPITCNGKQLSGNRIVLSGGYYQIKATSK